MAVISSKLIRMNLGLYQLSKIISIRNISDSSKKLVNNESSKTKQDDAEWFNVPKTNSNHSTTVRKNDYSNRMPPSYKIEQRNQQNSLLNEPDKEKKRLIIQQLIDSMNFQDFSLPNDFDEKEWNYLLDCKSINELKITLRKIPKDRYYKLLKEKKKIIVAQRLEANLASNELNENGFITNYPGNLSFLRRLDKKHFRDFLRQKLLASIRTDAPSIVFDFRYDTFHDKRYLLPSLYRQYVEIVYSNRMAPEPFQVHFCNYNTDGVFHKTYGKDINFDENLIQETNKSYLDLFPKEKLIYLSKDAGKPMKQYNPEKVYIIGSIIDSGLREDRFASYSQAKRDGIECLRLPIDENVKWQNGSKDLAMNHVFEILVRLYHQKPWQEALKALPTRFTNSYKKFN